MLCIRPMNKPYADIDSNSKNLGFPFNKISETVASKRTEYNLASVIGSEKLNSTIEVLSKKILFFEKRYGIKSSELEANYNKIACINVKGCNGFDDYHEWSRLIFIRDRISSKIK